MKMRAFYKPLNRMLEPDQIESINFDTKVLGVYMEMDGKGYHRLRLSDFEIMWYTGLPDRNGKEVYEGDIIQFEDMGEVGYEYKEGYDFTNQAVVVFENGRYTLDEFLDDNSGVMEELDDHEATCSVIQGSEVIGNRWTNPDLLEDRE
ncbi:YopX family protein [Paenibacillus sp. NPDC093718]|uniref:YopX family protein n=1 Tax=Paenibacillus sp. NPDC093718 TaxID=3390601 RepID=UPI003D06DB80